MPIPRRNAPDDERLRFHAYMLLPGLPIAFHAESLGRTRQSIWAYRSAAKTAAELDPRIDELARQYAAEMKPEDGLHMARLRGKSALPYWSRLAIYEYRKRGLSRSAIAKAFRCSPSTVANVLRGLDGGYDILSGQRRLTASQRHPPCSR